MLSRSQKIFYVKHQCVNISGFMDRSLTIEIVALPAMVIILTVLIVLFLVPSVFLAHGAQVWGQSLTNPNSCLLFVL